MLPFHDNILPRHEVLKRLPRARMAARTLNTQLLRVPGRNRSRGSAEGQSLVLVSGQSRVDKQLDRALVWLAVLIIQPDPGT